MAINTASRDPIDPILPKLEKRRDVIEWADDLNFNLVEILRKVSYDILNGASQFQVSSTIPTVDDIEEGGVVFYDDGAATQRMYTKLNGSLRYVTLS